MSARRGQIAFSSSLVLAVFALGGAVAAFFVASSAALAVLGGSACVAFVALVFGFVSLRGDRFRRSLGAILASLLVLTGIGVAFAVTSVRGFLSAVEAAQGPQPVVDEELQFRLTPPSDDAEMFDRDRAAELHARAVAGYLVHGAHEADTPELEVTVFMEPLYGLSLESAARLHLPQLGDGVTWQGALEPTSLSARDALRIRQQIAVAHDGGFDGAWWQEITFVEAHDHVYILRAQRHSREGAPTDETWFPRAPASFALLDGEVVTEVTHVAYEAHGAGWEVDGFTFRSSAWGVSLETDERWELLAGPRAFETWEGAIVVLRQRRPEVIARLLARPVAGRAEAQARADRYWPRHDRAPDTSPMEATFVGRAVAFDAVRTPEAWPGVGRLGVVVVGDRAIALEVFAPTLEAADAALRELAPRVSLTARSRSLGAWSHVGQDHWVRGDTLRFVDQGLRWTRPGPEWRAFPERHDYVGGDGLAVEEVLRLQAPGLGLEGTVYWSGAPSAAEAVEGEPLAGGHLQSLDASETDGLASIYWHARARHDWDLELEIVGSPADLAQHDAAVRAAIEGLRVSEELDEVGVGDDGVYRDARLGFEFAPPWPLDDVYVPDDDPGAVWLEAQEGAHLMALFAAPRRTERTVEEQARALLGDLYPRAPHFGRLREAPLGDCAGGEIVQRDAPMGLGGASLYRCVSDDVLFVLYVQRGPNGPDPQRIADGLTLSARPAQ